MVVAGVDRFPSWTTQHPLQLLKKMLATWSPNVSLWLNTIKSVNHTTATLNTRNKSTLRLSSINDVKYSMKIRSPKGDNRQHRMWSCCCGSRQPNTAGHRPAIVLTGIVISNQTAIKSSTSISWRNCPSNAVRRTFAQNSSIGKTCVNVKSRTCGACNTNNGKTIQAHNIGNIKNSQQYDGWKSAMRACWPH